MPNRASIKFGEVYPQTYWIPIRDADPYIDSKGHQFRRLHCICACGNERSVLLGNLTQGKSISCGCHRRKLNTKHGLSNTRLYHIWENIIQRCTNPNNSNYPNYGGRGVSVCSDWNDFDSFMKWALLNGYEENLTIDRVDVNIGYCPDNCRWATRYEQDNNKRNNHRIVVDGVSKTIKEWCDAYGVPETRVRSRIDLGWDAKRALTEPSHVK